MGEGDRETVEGARRAREVYFHYSHGAVNPLGRWCLTALPKWELSCNDKPFTKTGMEAHT
jgi:hypothetical protein